MTKNVLLIVLFIFYGNTFSQTMHENERRLSAILDTLDNQYYWQLTPEDMMGRIPPKHWQKKYPFRIKRNELLNEIKTTLEKPISLNYLFTLFDAKHKKKTSSNYRKIADKIMAFDSKDANLKLWNITANNVLISNKETYFNYQLTLYIVHKFISNNLFKDKTKAYVLRNNDFNVHYFGCIDKEVDLKVIDAQINYLKKEMKKEQYGDAPRWAGYLFLENGIRPKKGCSINYHNWYLLNFYSKKIEIGLEVSYSDFDWDNYNDKKNIELTIRFLKKIKEKYNEFSQECKN